MQVEFCLRKSSAERAGQNFAQSGDKQGIEVGDSPCGLWWLFAFGIVVKGVDQNMVHSGDRKGMKTAGFAREPVGWVCEEMYPKPT